MRDGSERAHLGAAQFADGKDNPKIKKAWLLLRMHADMRLPVVRGTRLNMLCVDACDGTPELPLHLGEKAVQAAALGKIAVEDIFQPRFVAVGPVSLGNEDAHDRIGDFAGFVWLDDGAGLARQILDVP